MEPKRLKSMVVSRSDGILEHFSASAVQQYAECDDKDIVLFLEETADNVRLLTREEKKTALAVLSKEKRDALQKKLRQLTLVDSSSRIFSQGEMSPWIDKIIDEDTAFNVLPEELEIFDWDLASELLGREELWSRSKKKESTTLIQKRKGELTSAIHRFESYELDVLVEFILLLQKIMISEELGDSKVNDMNFFAKDKFKSQILQNYIQYLRLAPHISVREIGEKSLDEEILHLNYNDKLVSRARSTWEYWTAQSKLNIKTRSWDGLNLSPIVIGAILAYGTVNCLFRARKTKFWGFAIKIATNTLRYTPEVPNSTKSSFKWYYPS